MTDGSTLPAGKAADPASPDLKPLALAVARKGAITPDIPKRDREERRWEIPELLAAAFADRLSGRGTGPLGRDAVQRHGRIAELRPPRSDQ